jgi:uncharacterized hydrophobic protein (TIGR00271 family)
LLELAVPEEDLEGALAVVDEHGFGHTSTPLSGDHGDRLLAILTPADAVEHLLDDLDEAGVDTSTFLVSLSAEFARFEGLDAVQNEWGDSPNRIAPATLRSKAKALRLNTRSYVWMMVLSGIVATAGLLVSSPAVVVGSMVIAPIVSPVLTASVGTVRNDRDMLVTSIHMQAVGLGVAIATGALVAWLVKTSGVVATSLAVDQLQLVGLRLAPSMLAITVGLAAGAAGAFGLATKGQVTIVGVMIAAALIPTAAVAGIGIAWGNPVLASGATLLLVLSIVAINVGGTAMLGYLGYRPDQVDEPIFSFDGAGQAVTVVGTLAVTLLAVVAVGVLFVQQSGFEHAVNRAVDDVVGPREALAVEETTIEYRPPFAAETTVTVEIARTGEASTSGLVDELAEAIREATDRPVTVQAAFVDYRRSEPA